MNEPANKPDHQFARQIRPEARPVDWETLDDAQQEAFRRIVHMVHEAASALRPANSSEPPPDDPIHWLSPDKSTKTVFLSGGRGSGKSTVMASLINATLLNSTVRFPQEASPEERIEMSPEDQHRDDVVKDVKNVVGKLRHRIVWLEQIDMETLPDNTNLLAAILARVEQAVARCVGFSAKQGKTDREYGGLLDLAHDYRGTMKSLQLLQNRVAQAWEGNLSERRSALDPDSYAVEVSRIERSRLSVNQSMKSVLNELADEVFRGTPLENPLFVLPVDDFELNPESCLQLLRLLRMVSVPRLFNIVLGDMSVVDTVLNLKFSNDIAAVGRHIRYPEASSIPISEAAGVAGELASNALRKLLPPGQRIQLGESTLPELGGFRMLFPGDAEVGSWQLISSRDDGTPDDAVLREMRNLDLYKVGHHDSDNVTPRNSQWKHIIRERSQTRPLHCLLSTQLTKYSDAIPDESLYKVMRKLPGVQMMSTAFLNEADRDDVHSEWNATTRTIKGNTKVMAYARTFDLSKHES